MRHAYDSGRSPVSRGDQIVAMRGRTGEVLGALTVYVALYAAWNASGAAFHVWPDLWQLMPWPPLVDDLGGAMLDLHSQPPLLNLVFGLALQASIATRVSVATLLQPVFFACGAAAVAAFALLARRLIPRPMVRLAVVIIFLANPYLYASLHYFFYTPLELLFLLWSGLLGFRYMDDSGPGRLAAALVPALLLVYARSLFHPIWFAGFVALLLALAWPRGRWKVVAPVLLASFVLLGAWPAKNLARFGFFGFSSWSGMSLARGLPTGDPLLPSGFPARLGAFARPSNEPPVPGSLERAAGMVPPEFQGRPALSVVVKPDGSPNWNHYALIPLSRELGAIAVGTLLEHPALLLMKAGDFYANGYALYEARWPYRGDFAPEMTAGHTWARIYEGIVFQPFRTYDPTSTAVTTGFAFLLPLLLMATGIQLWRRRKAWSTTDRTIVLLAFSVVWVLALVLLVDGPEGNRVRFSTEPFLFIMAGWLTGRPTARPADAPSPGQA